MTDSISTLREFAVFERGRLSRKIFSQSFVGAAVLAFSMTAGAWVLYARLAPAPDAQKAADTSLATTKPESALPSDTSSKTVAAAPHAALALHDLTASLGVAPFPFSKSAPLRPNFGSLAPVSHAPVSPAPAPEASVAEEKNVQPTPAPESELAELTDEEPMPVPRPSSLPAARSVDVPDASRRGLLGVRGRQTAEQSGTTTVTPAPTDGRNFFEKLFGSQQQRSSGPALAYAAPEDGLFSARRSTSAPVSLPYDRATAVYDISAHTVYLPDGTRLEAHSGLGSWLDDPRYVTEHNRGATPPNVYDLELRAQPFHGVRALRLNPTGGTVYGRTGLLAHTYMLGPRGDSNGCVSFRDYRAFLRAYENGQIRRLAVVAHLN
jgi:hypothetical protein